MPKAAGKWNTYDITAKGDHFVVIFNGQKTVDVTDKRLLDAGPIALQYGSGSSEVAQGPDPVALMKDLSGRLAVVTGGGSGMGRELVRQLVAEGCSIAICDVSASGLAETKRLCEQERLPQGLRITTHIADVADEAQVKRFRDEVGDAARHRPHPSAVQQCRHRRRLSACSPTAATNGSAPSTSAGAASIYCTRAFLPMLQKADKGHIVNTISVNGFWAQIGAHIPQTAYSAAKFAVKGFSEALQTDLRLNAPHIKCSVVMPGHIGTGIAPTPARSRAATRPTR